jgi:hypothetical protein
MKRKHVVFLGFMLTLVLAGCSLEFPSKFEGAWIRDEEPRTTLIFTSTNVKASNQNYQWHIVKVRGDDYYMKSTNGSDGAFNAVLSGGKLHIRDLYTEYTANPENWKDKVDDWTGTWVKQ